MFRALANRLSAVAGLMGIVLCLVGVGGRVLGHYSIAHFDVMTLFIVGTGLMVFSIYVKLFLVSESK